MAFRFYVILCFIVLTIVIGFFLNKMYYNYFTECTECKQREVDKMTSTTDVDSSKQAVDMDSFLDD